MKSPQELKRLSSTEWRIMNLCWRLGKSTARQIHEASLEERKRDYQTVKTLLDRIVKKGYLEMEKLGPLCLYTPAVERQAATTGAIDEFTETVLDRTLAPLFVHLAEREDLSEEDVRALRELVEQLDGQAEGNGQA